MMPHPASTRDGRYSFAALWFWKTWRERPTSAAGGRMADDVSQGDCGFEVARSWWIREVSSVDAVHAASVALQ